MTRGGTRHATRRRRGPALEAIVALFVFALGFEVAPALHQMGHATWSPHAHVHALNADADASPTLSAQDRRDAHAHDAHAHRGLLFFSPQSPMPMIPLAGLVGRSSAFDAPTMQARVHRAAITARGPPARA